MNPQKWPIAIVMTPERRRKERRQLAASNARASLAYNSLEAQEKRHHPVCRNIECKSHNATGHRRWFSGCCSKYCQKVMAAIEREANRNRVFNPLRFGKKRASVKRATGKSLVFQP